MQEPKMLTIGVRRGSAAVQLFSAFVLLSCAGESDTLVDDGESGLARQTITAQPDPSCTVARFGSHDYWICSAAKSFQAAEAVCGGVGMHLARPDDAAESEFLRSRAVADVWIGASDSAAEGQWRWLDDDAQFWQGNRTGSGVNGFYNRWASGEPNDWFGEDCAVLLRSSGNWNDVSCALARAFVCESDATTASQPQAPDSACTRTTRGGSTYWTCSNERSWDEARSNCQEAGMDLVAVDDAAEATFVKGILRQSAHIGLSDREHEGTWRWSHDGAVSFCADGGRVPPGGYASWASGQPAADGSCRSVDGGGERYWICDGLFSHVSAAGQCASSPGSSLARIDSAAENALLTANLVADTWIGGSDASQEGSWRWNGGEPFWSGAQSGAPVAGRYTNWGWNEPNNVNNEDCAVLAPFTGKWRDEPCNSVPYYHSFVCEGAADAQRPDTSDCAFSAYPSGEWSSGRCDAPRSYICESLPSDPGFGKTLDEVTSNVREDFRSGVPRVDQATFTSSIDVARLFRRTPERFGLDACTDSIEATDRTRALPYVGLEDTYYQQLHRGVPVIGRGYAVRSVPGSGELRSLRGRAEAHLDLDPTPTVSEASARALAATALGAASLPSSLSGQLAIIPTRQGRDAEWELAWLFRPATPGRAHESSFVAISASTGRTLVARSTLRTACNTAPLPNAPWRHQGIEVDTFQQDLWGDPNDVRVIQNTLDASRPFLLFSDGLEDSGPLAVGPVMTTYCDDNRAAGVAVVGSSRLRVNADSGDGEHAAAMFAALQRCMRSLAGQVESRPGVPWLGFDGAGEVPIDVIFGDHPVGNHFNGDDYSLHFMPYPSITGSGYDGASIELACHEFTHGIWHALYAGLIAQDPSLELDEVRTLDEGLADIIGSAVEMLVREPAQGIPGPGGFCFYGDGSQNTECLRDFVNPLASTELACKLVDASGRPRFAGCPSEYDSSEYCRGDRDCGGEGCCGPHRNSTVLSHWFYRLAMGDAGVNSAGCAYDIEPLDPDPAIAVRKALQITFTGVRDYLAEPGGGYAALASATLDAAQQLHGAGSPEAQRVATGWYAANVREAYFEKDEPYIQPRRSASDVNPWQWFVWPRRGDETSWDFQLYAGSVAPENLVHEQYEVEGVVRSWLVMTAPTLAYLPLTLPASSESRYFWRVRPHQSGPWTPCEPVHSFVKTRKLETATEVSVGRVGDDGLVKPGQARVAWTRVEGAVGYKVQVSTSPTDCRSAAGADEVTVSDLPEVRGEAFHLPPTALLPVLPETAYYASVQPIGPKTPSGDVPVGECSSVSFRTGALEPPHLTFPNANTQFGFASPHKGWTSNAEQLSFRWWGTGNPASYDVSFYKRTASGGCAATVAKTQRVNASCDSSDALCYAELTQDVFTNPYPGGYCWSVVAIGENGARSPASEKRPFRWFIDITPGMAPGADTAVGYDQKLPAAIPGDSYGDPVTFSWSKVQKAVAYSVRVAKWPWLTPGDWISCPPSPPYTGCSIEEGTTLLRTVSGTSLTAAGHEAGEGRYCWQVIPLFPDPDVPGTPAPVQPEHQRDAFCYTTGPAKPIIEVKNKPSAGQQWAPGPITGKVKLPFVPDAQFNFAPSPGLQWSAPWCTMQNIKFQDVIDCERTFTIADPKPETRYDVRVEVFNSNAAGGTPVMDGTTSTHLVIESFTTGKCGAAGEVCCPNDTCDQAQFSLTCTNNKCSCKPKTQAQVCGGNSCGSRADGCGGTIQCGGCGSGQTCDGTTCYTPTISCDASQDPIAGSNDRDERTVELGRSSGTASIVYRTYDIADRIRVIYEGQDLIDTECFGTDDLNAGCVTTTSGVRSCCNVVFEEGVGHMECTTSRAYSGSATQVTVVVEPNCGGDVDTQWKYKMLCP